MADEKERKLDWFESGTEEKIKWIKETWNFSEKRARKAGCLRMSQENKKTHNEPKRKTTRSIV